MEKKLQKQWPEDCIWPRPVMNNEGGYWEADTVYGLTIDEETEQLLFIKDYYDDMVEEGKLDSVYRLIDESEQWKPDIGEEYWIDNRFDIDLLEDDLSERMNHLKLLAVFSEDDPVVYIRDLIHYEFINEKTLLVPCLT